MITNDAVLSLTAASVSTGDVLHLFINNLDGGAIGGSATVGFDVSGGVTAATDATFEIISGNNPGVTEISSIGSDAAIAFSSDSFSAGSLLTQIFSQDGASIGGAANLSFTVAGALSTTGNTTFRIVDSDDGQGLGGGSISGDATINVNVGSLSAAALVARINSLGGTIGGDSDIVFGVTGALTTTGNATFEVLEAFASEPAASVAVSAGSYTIGGNLVARISDTESSFGVENVSVNATNDIAVTGSINVDGNVIAGGNISGDGGIFTPGDPSMVSAGGSINAPGIIAGTLIAGDAITIDNNTADFGFGIIANTISAGGNLNLINAPSISPNNTSSDGTIGFTPHDFSLTAANIISTGPTYPSLISNGSDTDPNFANGNPGNGGNITVNITNAGLNVGATDDLTEIVANGGEFANGAILGGNGGTIDITATEDVNVNGPISATSGVNPTGTPAGNGGTVSITTSGTVNVNDTITASSNEQQTTGPVSAKGGNINVTSSRPAGVAINVGNSGQLLALLNAAAPGPGGKITILATGANSQVTAKGNIAADRGTIDIRHTGANGEIYTGGSPDFLNAHADVVKIGALGANGTLTVGNGSLTADSVLKLYAPTSNGTLDFIANVTISSGTDAILAANTVTIQPSVVVTVQGNGGAAQVFTNNPNYSGFGGTNRSNGTFGGNGANNPLPLDQAPPFDGPPPGHH